MQELRDLLRNDELQAGRLHAGYPGYRSERVSGAAPGFAPRYP